MHFGNHIVNERRELISMYILCSPPCWGKSKMQQGYIVFFGAWTWYIRVEAKKKHITWANKKAFLIKIVVQQRSSISSQAEAKGFPLKRDKTFHISFSMQVNKWLWKLFFLPFPPVLHYTGLHMLIKLFYVFMKNPQIW